MIPALDYKSDRFATLLLLPTATSNCLEANGSEQAGQGETNYHEDDSYF